MGPKSRAARRFRQSLVQGRAIVLRVARSVGQWANVPAGPRRRSRQRRMALRHGRRESHVDDGPLKPRRYYFVRLAGYEAQRRDLQAAGCIKIFAEQVSSVAEREQLNAA